MCCCVCVFLQREYNGDGCLSASILFKYEFRMFVLTWTKVRRVSLGSAVSL